MAAMSGSDFYAYILRTFKRTDKSTELYEAITDACQEMAQRFPFDELSNETNTTDTISVAGDYRISLESDFEMLISDIVVIDGTDSWPLIKRTKSEFDELYPNPSASNVPTAKPIDYCIYDGVIYLGPVPDKTTYSYKISYEQEPGTIISGTASVPFTDKYRRPLKYLVLHYEYSDLEMDEAAAKYRGLFEVEFQRITSLEYKNKTGISTVAFQDI